MTRRLYDRFQAVLDGGAWAEETRLARVREAAKRRERDRAKKEFRRDQVIRAWFEKKQGDFEELEVTFPRQGAPNILRAMRGGKNLKAQLGLEYIEFAMQLDPGIQKIRREMEKRRAPKITRNAGDVSAALWSLDRQAVRAHGQDAVRRRHAHRKLAQGQHGGDGPVP
jgi:hypothetical protein